MVQLDQSYRLNYAFLHLSTKNLLLKLFRQLSLDIPGNCRIKKFLVMVFFGRRIIAINARFTDTHDDTGSVS